MMPRTFDMHPGDILLYRGTGFWSRGIQLATASWITHTAMYDGGGFMWESKERIGVRRTEVRTDDLYKVMCLHDHVPFDIGAARIWWAQSEGQDYDWKGLLTSRLPGRQGAADSDEKQFCSEATVRAQRVGIASRLGLPTKTWIKHALAAVGLDPFNAKDADGIYPGLYETCALMKERGYL